MITQELKDRGVMCKGKGLNCQKCKDKNECVECRIIKIGSEVEFVDIPAQKTRTGKVVLVTNIKESMIEENVGKDLYFIEYWEACYPKYLFASEFKVIKY